MVERQDIDALLIGALYGELTPADEARLQTHFESHPGDRSALNAMTDTRQAVRESRILQVQLEPPQSVSALLLQEAARRAPRKVEHKELSEGWFARFMRSFVAHPAMAAAAMLVLVVGVAGTMYLRKGDQFAEKTYDSRALPAPAAGSAAAAPEGASTTITATATEETALEAEQLQRQAGSGYGVGLAGALDEIDGKAEGKLKVTERKGSSYLEVKPQDRQPKELDDAPKKAPAKEATKQVLAKPSITKAPARSEGKPAPASDADSLGQAASRPADPAQSSENQAPQAAPPPPPPAPTAGDTRDRTAPGGGGKLEPGDAAVRDLHARLVNQVKAGNCREAASLAIEISGRSRSYYLQNVESDRALKACRAYISAELERETVRAQKRATQKRAAEPAKTTK
ncbi:MAG: hypothetical protein WKG01_36435 [Kofleriaceae bacterium]